MSWLSNLSGLRVSGQDESGNSSVRCRRPAGRLQDHPDLTSGGSIMSASGNYDCAEGSTCEIDVPNGERFAETFSAAARHGYGFVGWRCSESYLCAGYTPLCVVGIASSVTVPGHRPPSRSRSTGLSVAFGRAEDIQAGEGVPVAAVEAAIRLDFGARRRSEHRARRQRKMQGAQCKGDVRCVRARQSTEDFRPPGAVP